MTTTNLNDRLVRARVRLALAHPFLATALMRLPLCEVVGQGWCATAATDGYHIFYNPDWIAGLDDPSLRGLLAHEVLHVLFAHPARHGGREARVWNWACDFAINGLLVEQGFVLPAGGLISRAFAGQTAEEIYQRLLDEAKSGGPQRVNAAGRLRDPSQGAGGEPGSATLSESAIPVAGADLIDTDDPRVRPYRTPDAPDSEQAEALRRELRADAQARLSGDLAGSFASLCSAADEARVNWRGLLRDRLTERIKGDWMSYPFSKRHVHRGLFMPSPGMAVPGHIVFAIDTSGSMSDAVLGEIVAELRAFREAFPCRTTVIQADTVVQSVTQFEAMDGMEIPQRLQVRGRGGTDFRAVFEWVAREAPDATVLYATDGAGRFPASAPANAVIWLATHRRPMQVPFGAVVPVRAG